MTERKRSYRMLRRAEAEARTRLRITESAVALHGTLGPARTSVSAIAAHAGVRRSTVYRHFPDEHALFAGCSSHWLAAHPTPDAASWARIEDPELRLRTGLGELYAFYRRGQGMIGNLLRDEPLAPVVTRFMGGYRDFAAAALEALMAGRPTQGPGGRRLRAALGHALAFATWHSLAVDQGLDDPEVVELMAGFAALAQLAGEVPGGGGQASTG